MTKGISSAILRCVSLLCVAVALSACAARPKVETDPPVQIAALDESRAHLALLEAKDKQAKGQRVWCVPFARTASGVEIKGDAKHWWKSAKGSYARGDDPRVGAVMSFAPTRGMSRGHVAVVSQVLGPREIQINHANWVKNKVQLGMRVVDVSKQGDWSQVKVERVKGEMGVSNYPVNGFIYPK